MVKKLEKKECKSSVFSTVAGPTLETLTRNKYFFQTFQTQGRNSNTADQHFGEDVFWNIYGGNETFLKNYVTGEPVQRDQKIFFKKYLIFIRFGFQEHQKCIFFASSYVSTMTAHTRDT